MNHVTSPLVIVPSINTKDLVLALEMSQDIVKIPSSNSVSRGTTGSVSGPCPANATIIGCAIYTTRRTVSYVKLM